MAAPRNQRWPTVASRPAASPGGSGGWAQGVLGVAVLSCAVLLFRPGFAAVDPAPALLPGTAANSSPALAGPAPAAQPGEAPLLHLTATLGSDDGLAAMLRRAGIGAGDAASAAALIDGAVSGEDLRPGTAVAITAGPRASATVPRPLERLALRPRLDLSLTVERRGGALVLARQVIPVDLTPVRFRGIAGASLYRSARAAGVPASAAQQYLRAVGRQLSLERDVAPADEFDVVLARKRTAEGEQELGEVLYAGLDRQGRAPVRLVRWGNPGGKGSRGEFFDATGEAAPAATALTESRPLQPVAGRVTSRFGPRRHPILGFTRMHAGIDIRAPRGTAVRATADGVVAFAGRHGGHGNFVRLAHGGSLGTGYAHLSGFAVRPGEAVRRGEVIGFVGSTGLSTGPHLHYEMYSGGRPVDPGSMGPGTIGPAPMQVASAPAITGLELEVLQERVAELRRLPSAPPPLP